MMSLFSAFDPLSPEGAVGSSTAASGNHSVIQPHQVPHPKILTAKYVGSRHHFHSLI